MRKKSTITSDQYNADDDEPHDGSERASKVYKVSSHHLINASHKFRSESAGPWIESVRSEDGMFHLTTCDWDAEASEIMLNVYHLRHRRLPKT